MMKIPFGIEVNRLRREALRSGENGAELSAGAMPFSGTGNARKLIAPLGGGEKFSLSFWVEGALHLPRCAVQSEGKAASPCPVEPLWARARLIQSR
jgi:hypothetical protein